MTERKWSPYSENIKCAYTDTTDNLIISACPGAGKTTNIDRLWSMDDKPTLYVVFAKHNQLEAQAKLPRKENSVALTLNSLGARAIYNHFGRLQLNERKVLDIIRKHYPIRTNEGREEQYMLSKIVGVVKCIDTDNMFSQQMYDAIVDTYDLDVKDNLYNKAAHVLELSDNETRQVDYADQLRFPVIYDLSMPAYHNVLGDEVQDFNPIQTELIARIEAERYVLVGDKHQSIYGFRGAMNNAMSVLKEQFNCVELPLSITYRCAKSIVGEAHRIYPDIEAWDESPQGVVRDYNPSHAEQYTAQDIILCRTNRPLIQLAYELLANGTPCHVRGRDIGDGLVKLIERQGCFTVRELIGRLNEEYEVEMEKARVREDESKQQRLHDRYTSALLFCNRTKLDKPPRAVVNAINMLFDQGRGTCLSTVHKAKGLEAERAFLLESKMFDTFTSRVSQHWQKEQERNIKYVAITRAKRELVYM
jgi:hypothetical protein